jgi:phage protein D
VVQVQGRALAPTVIADIISITVDLEIDKLSSFSIQINNWEADPTKLGFKYSDAQLFDVGHTVYIQLGYADQVESMVRGIITSMTPAFPEAGPPTITITGQDALVILRDRSATGGEQRKFANKTDGEIAELIATRNQLAVHVDKTGTKNPVVYQRDLDDALFLLERAKRVDFDCYIDNDPTTRNATLYFQPPSDGRSAQQQSQTYQLNWGRDLIQFMPTITIARQVSSVTVRGWDDVNKTTIIGHADASAIPNKTKSGVSGPELVADRLRAKEQVTVDRPVQSKQEADTLAAAMLRNRAYGFITGEGQCIGQPALQPGDNLLLYGLGKRYSGKYYVTKTSHKFGAQGYLTDFSVRRDFDGGVSS